MTTHDKWRNSHHEVDDIERRDDAREDNAEAEVRQGPTLRWEEQEWGTAALANFANGYTGAPPHFD